MKTLTAPFKSGLLLALPLLAGACLWPASASAYDRGHDRDRDRNHGFVRVEFGRPDYYRPAPVYPAVERRYVAGHYETRCETVLAEPAHYEDRYVPPVCETLYDRYGHARTIEVQRGYNTRVYVPARYEKREVSTWVPGYYQDVPVCVPAPVYERPHFSLGGFFGF